MSDTKISALAALAGADAASGDLIVAVDVSDSTMDASGTDKKMTLDELATAVATYLTGKTQLAPAIVASLGVGPTVLSLSSAATNDDPTEIMFQGRNAFTSATTISVGTFTTTTDTTVLVEAAVVARRTGGTAGTAGDGAGYLLYATFKNVGGTTTQIGTTTQAVVHESQAGWNATIDNSGNTIRVRCTGATDNSVTWHSHVRYWTVGS